MMTHDRYASNISKLAVSSDLCDFQEWLLAAITSKSSVISTDLSGASLLRRDRELGVVEVLALRTSNTANIYNNHHYHSLMTTLMTSKRTLVLQKPLSPV